MKEFCAIMVIYERPTVIIEKLEVADVVTVSPTNKGVDCPLLPIDPGLLS